MQIAASAQRKGYLFSMYFKTVQSDTCVHDMPHIIQLDNDMPTLYNMQFSLQEVINVIYKLDANKALGPDNISPRVLEECALELAPSLADLFNYSMYIGALPDQWKLAHVTPVFKKGDKNSVTNYKPMSLLCNIQSHGTLYLQSDN